MLKGKSPFKTDTRTHKQEILRKHRISMRVCPRLRRRANRSCRKRQGKVKGSLKTSAPDQPQNTVLDSGRGLCCPRLSSNPGDRPEEASLGACRYLWLTTTWVKVETQQQLCYQVETFLWPQSIKMSMVNLAFRCFFGSIWCSNKKFFTVAKQIGNRMLT